MGGMDGQGFDYAFTVFTPTYNRAHTLPRVYQSLAAQTFRDFEWLIIDDGSTDNTTELVAAWQGQAAFPIRYERQANQGKHVAFNRGVALARGRLFLPLDSDDACLPQALERLHHHWQGIPEAQRGRFAAVTALCQDEQGRLVGRPLPQAVLDSDAIAIKRRHRHATEKWGFTRTDLLRRFPYPEPPGARFVPEDLVWSAIAQAGFATRFVNEPLRVYHQGADQLTGGGLRPGQAPGLALWHQAVLNQEIGWLGSDPLGFFRSAVHYARFSFLQGRGPAAQWQGLGNGRARLLWLLGLGPGWLLAWRDRRQGLET